MLAARAAPHIAPRWLIIGGGLLVLAAMLYGSTLTRTIPYFPDLVAPIVVGGFGIGVISVILPLCAVAEVGPKEIGPVSAITLMVYNLGGPLVLVVVQAVQTSRTLYLGGTTGPVSDMTPAQLDALDYGYTYSLLWVAGSRRAGRGGRVLDRLLRPPDRHRPAHPGGRRGRRALGRRRVEPTNDPSPDSFRMQPSPQAANKHVAPERPETLRDRFNDAVAPRSLLLGLGVLLLQLAFIWSYIGAFHSPDPHHIPVTVVGPPQLSAQLAHQLEALPGEPVSVRTGDDAAAARQALRNGQTSGVFLVAPRGSRDTLLVASGGGVAVAQAVEKVFTGVDGRQQRSVDVTDVVPLQPGDARGLSGFYLVIGWVVGGYLFAAMLGIAKGSRPATFPRARWRLGATVPYALLSGLGGAAIAGPWLGALTGHFWEIAGIGTLVTLASATVTIALETLFGIVGIGVTVILFVILGNPSAGGAFQPPMLPPFWRALNLVLPNGDGTDAIRRIVYFNGHGIALPAGILAAWIVGGVVVTLVAARVIHRGQRATVPPASSSA